MQTENHIVISRLVATDDVDYVSKSLQVLLQSFSFKWDTFDSIAYIKKALTDEYDIIRRSSYN